MYAVDCKKWEYNFCCTRQNHEIEWFAYSVPEAIGVEPQSTSYSKSVSLISIFIALKISILYLFNVPSAQMSLNNK